MSFLFASSHLPAVRSTRPELEEEEEENVNPESLLRSGGVRASSHLEERVPESEATRRAGGSPAPRNGGAASEWPGWLQEQLDPQRTRQNSAEPDQHPRRADAEREPDAEPDHDADEAPGIKSEESPEHKNTRSWYQPPESGSYHPDPSFYIRPEDVGPASPDHGFYQHLPEGEERGASDAWGGGEHPSSQEWRVRRSDEIQDQPPGGQRGVGPNVTAGSVPASGRTGAFPNSRLFERRSAPAAFFKQQQPMHEAGGPMAQQRLQGIRQAIAAQQQVRGSAPQEQAGRLIAQQPAPPQPPEQAPRQSGPAMQQNQGINANRQGAGTTPAKNGKHPLTVLCEKFAEFPKVVEALIKLYRVPTGRRMIEKLATVADKIHAIQTKDKNAYVDNAGMHLKKDKDDDISADTLGHEFQHLGEILFNTPNPFLKVEDPNDLTAYPGSAPFAKEFRAMRIQNQLLLERYQMMQKPPILLPIYYDDKTPFKIPGSLLPWD